MAKLTLKSRITSLFITLTSAAMITCSAAESYLLSEYEIKAAFLFNFAKFVEWPQGTFPQESDPLVFGFLGKDFFGPAANEVLGGKTIQNRKLVLKNLNAPSQIKDCHVLFISKSEEAQLHDILNNAKEKPILTVSDISDFTGRGGMIGFVLEDKKVRFNVNTIASESVHLRLSSQFLKLAKNVTMNPEPEKK